MARPSTTTQLAIIRKHLLNGMTITPIEALELCGCFRLSSVIHRLRHVENIPIRMCQPEATEGKPYVRYWIDTNWLALNGRKEVADA